MTKFVNRSFSEFFGSDAYKKGWDRIFGEKKKPEEKTEEKTEEDDRVDDDEHRSGGA